MSHSTKKKIFSIAIPKWPESALENVLWRELLFFFFFPKFVGVLGGGFLIHKEKGINCCHGLDVMW